MFWVFFIILWEYGISMCAVCTCMNGEGYMWSTCTCRARAGSVCSSVTLDLSSLRQSLSLNLKLIPVMLTGQQAPVVLLSLQHWHYRHRSPAWLLCWYWGSELIQPQDLPTHYNRSFLMQPLHIGLLCVGLGFVVLSFRTPVPSFLCPQPSSPSLYFSCLSAPFSPPSPCSTAHLSPKLWLPTNAYARQVIPQLPYLASYGIIKLVLDLII